MSRIIIAKKTGKGCSNSHDKLACLLLRKMEQGQLINVTSPKSKTNPETLVVLDDDNLQHMRDEPGEIQPTSSRESELLSAIPQEFVMDDNGLEQLRVASGNIEVEVIDVINKSFCCTECNHKTTTPKKLSAHLRAQHPDRIVSCSYCDYTSNYKVMKSHLEVMHSRENPFPCDECEQRFSKYSLLKDHQAAHSENRKFVCPTCDQVFSTKARLKSHMPSHGVSKYICDTCGGAFNSSKELSHHTIVDHGKKSYDCELCEYSCFSPGVLARHLRTHTGEKPFPCDFCDYRATEKARLKSHLMAAHSNNKPYACTLCDYRTTRKDHLNVHIISHSQVKPFACDYCPLRCTTRGKLKEHMRMHTGEKPYSCDFCEYRAARKDYLYSHLRQHSGVPVKPRSKKSQLETTETSPKTQPRGPRLPKFFTCEICDYRMTTRDEFEAHMLIHSSKNPEPSKMVSERTEDQVAGLYLDNLADNHFEDVLEMSDSERDALGVLANAASFDMPVHDIIVVGSDMCVEVPQVQVPQVEVPQVEPETPLPKKSVKVLPPKSNKSAVLVVSEEPGEVRVASDQIDLIFACDLCDFRSQRRSQLKDHVTIEHPLSDSTVFLEDVVDKLGQKVYLCDYCNYSTIHPSAISVHTRTHTGEKRYGCTQCEYKSATLRRMREHVMIHLGHKPFACDQCEYSTARKDHLRVHKLFHTGEKPHGCDYCPYRCRTKEKLTVHMRIHTGEKPYACKHCDYRATRKDYMTSHMRQHVPGASPRPKRPKKNAPQVQQKRGRDTSSSSDSSDSEDDNENENENEVWM